MSKFTGRNKEIAKWLGEQPDEFRDPGFCLGCGEAECECYEVGDYEDSDEE